MQNLSIGIISQIMPKDFSKKSLFPHLGAKLFWFNEIEAVYAFLLHSKLDQIFIDSKNTTNTNEKYCKLFAQMHPEIIIKNINLAHGKVSKISDDRIVYYPQLETLFNKGTVKSVYQPIVEKIGKKFQVFGIECLSRFSFQDHNYPPEILFQYAQEKLTLNEYDRLCLSEALKKAPRSNDMLFFVNVRPQTLINKDFSFWLLNLLKNVDIDPKKVVIEITEQQCIISEKQLDHQCQNMVTSGFSFAVDDFGTGVSNLSLLEIMKPKFIKIPGRFINGINKNYFKKSIVHHILKLARDLNINCIAENVENEDDWRALEILGANIAQGFYFFRPMSSSEIESIRI